MTVIESRASAARSRSARRRGATSPASSRTVARRRRSTIRATWWRRSAPTSCSGTRPALRDLNGTAIQDFDAASTTPGLVQYSIDNNLASVAFVFTPNLNGRRSRSRLDARARIRRRRQHAADPDLTGRWSAARRLRGSGTPARSRRPRASPTGRSRRGRAPDPGAKPRRLLSRRPPPGAGAGQRRCPTASPSRAPRSSRRRSTRPGASSGVSPRRRPRQGRSWPRPRPGLRAARLRTPGRVDGLRDAAELVGRDRLVRRLCRRYQLRLGGAQHPRELLPGARDRVDARRVARPLRKRRRAHLRGAGSVSNLRQRIRVVYERHRARGHDVSARP